MKIIVSCILIVIISASAFAETLTDGPFRGIDLSSVTENEALAISHANSDIQLVLSGSEPKFAVKGKNKYHLPSDPRRNHILTYD
jgi:hypothetical protein